MLRKTRRLSDVTVGYNASVMAHVRVETRATNFRINHHGH